ncbi:MAG: HAMP domain-containing protein [Deltaproteobacteria bacterium]|jgi:two-component system nitrogen regulation sensor histidine kinase NtrY|nr:HAMP domain-containing protein [Deltaproteobacteria bacterium]
MSASPDKPSQEQGQKKKSFERGLIILALLVLALLIVVQREVLNLGPGLSSNQGVITLVSINISVLILGLLLFLILRGLYRIFFEKMGGSLQTKMVISFVGLSLIPTLLTFYFSYLLIGQGQDTWFSSSIRTTLSDALSLAEHTQELDQKLLHSNLEDMAIELSVIISKDAPGESKEQISSYLDVKLASLGLQTAEFYDPQGLLIAASGTYQDPIPQQWFNMGRFDGRPAVAQVYDDSRQQVMRLCKTVLVQDKTLGHIAIGSLSSLAIAAKIDEVRQGLAKYQAALGILRPFRVSQMTSLAGVTLLAVFLSIWIGSHLAGSLAGPVTELVEGTKKVAKGDLDFVLTPVNKSGEMAHLVAAFNQMTRELKESYSEIDRRRRFVETVLRQVSTGVLIFDLDNKLLNLNKSARDMLDLRSFNLEDAEPQVIAEIQSVLNKASKPPAHAFVELDANRTLSLTLRRTTLNDEEGRELGFLVTFDDLSELEKAQRLAAWQEVARRIAHEIKNPLTPISLSAQRLRRRFNERLAAEDDWAVFDECTTVIIRQVESMRNLVNEFSQFARLPAINPKPADFVAVVNESLSLFRTAHPGLKFSLTVLTPPDIFVFDPGQIGRVVTNLLTNSAVATEGHGAIEVQIDLDGLTGVRLTISDDGPGLSSEVRDRLFEPYVTSTKDGQGLGLTIVSAIVRDHGGFIRVFDNQPKGTSFVVTIPYRKN